MRIIPAIGIMLLAALLTTPPVFAQAPDQPLEGFELKGENWTLKDGDSTLSGILMKPEGDGPFPAIIISHGMGGSAQGFATPKAREMVNWGFVCIATSYTHAGRAEFTGTARPRRQPSATQPATRPATRAAGRRAGRAGIPRDAGASPENLRRASQCIEILKSLPYVDESRICAYGNSMGAFLTVALAAERPGDIAAAITAGGIRPAGASDASAASPDADKAGNIRAPFIIFHGSADGTVRPEMSEALKKVLDQNEVPNERHLFEGVGHNAHAERADEVYDKMRQFFFKHGILAAKAKP